jgi:hypothetical protein
MFCYINPFLLLLNFAHHLLSILRDDLTTLFPSINTAGHDPTDRKRAQVHTRK